MVNPKKSLGQNFLNDQNIIRKITSSINIKNRNIVEIGPGLGAITDKILEKKPKSLILIEKDKNLLEKLKIKYKNMKLIYYYNSDILTFNIEKILKKDSVIFGNLPYNISSQIFIKLIKFQKWPPKYKNLILMFQKEVAEKISGKSYGRLTIMTNYKLKVINKFNVSANCFFPKPKVTSTVINFVPIKFKKFKIKDIKNLEFITHSFFSNKRKMIKKNFFKIFKRKNVRKFDNLNLCLRPSELNEEFYYQATEIFENS